MPTIGQTRPHPEWRLIVDLFRAVEYGDVITHQTLRQTTGLKAETTAYYRQVSQARRVLLREHGIEVESEARIGYRRVEPARYGERSRRDVRLGGKRIRRGRAVLEAAPIHLLTPEQVKEVEHMLVKMNALKALLNSTIRSMRNVLPPVAPSTRKLLSAATEENTTAH